MSDLISRSALIEELSKKFVNNSIHKNDLAEIIANLPTAYDVEKVVADDICRIVRKGGVNEPK